MMGCGKCGCTEFLAPVRCYQCGLPICAFCVVETNSGLRHWMCPHYTAWQVGKRGGYST